jgi:hypothetical protein
VFIGMAAISQQRIIASRAYCREVLMHWARRWSADTKTFALICPFDATIAA